MRAVCRRQPAAWCPGPGGVAGRGPGGGLPPQPVRPLSTLGPPAARLPLSLPPVIPDWCASLCAPPSCSGQIQLEQLVHWFHGSGARRKRYRLGGAPVLVCGPSGRLPGAAQLPAASSCCIGRSLHAGGTDAHKSHCLFAPRFRLQFYSCSTDPRPGSPPPAVAQVTSIVLTAGDGGMRNASIYVGSDPASVFSNTLVAVGCLPAPHGLRGCGEDAAAAAGGRKVPRSGPCHPCRP